MLQCARQLLNKTISSILVVQKEKGGDVDGIYEGTGYEVLYRAWLPNVASVDKDIGYVTEDMATEEGSCNQGSQLQDVVLATADKRE